MAPNDTLAPPVDPFPERGVIPRARANGTVSGLLDSTLRATGRTLGFFVDSVTGARGRDLEAVAFPSPGWRPLAGWHAALDEAILVYFEAGRSGLLDADFERIELEIEDLIAHHDHVGVADNPHSHHDDPPAPSDPEIRPREFAGAAGEWMTFESEWEPHPLAPGRDRWLSYENNRTVHVGLLRHDDGPRPWLVLIHGAEMGRTKLDARMFRAEHLHRSLGVNVALPVLPRHGPRREDTGAVRGAFPSIEMAENIHGISQSVWDVRRTLTWIRTQEATAIGAFGFSLGGHVAAFLAGFEADLDALVVSCPAVDLVELFRRNTPPLAVGNDRLDTLFERAALAHQPISPMSFPRVIDRENIVMFGAFADRLSDPVDQLPRLWHHWDQPELQVIDSGHVSYFMRRLPLERLEDALIARGVGSRQPDAKEATARFAAPRPRRR